MEAIILKFKDLAEEVCDFCQSLQIDGSWKLHKPNIYVYFDNGYSTKSVQFGPNNMLEKSRVNVALYSGVVSFGYHLKESDIIGIYEECLKDFNDYKTNNIENVRREFEESKQKRIEQIKKELEELEK